MSRVFPALQQLQNSSDDEFKTRALVVSVLFLMCPNSYLFLVRTSSIIVLINGYPLELNLHSDPVQNRFFWRFGRELPALQRGLAAGAVQVV